jgi:hypothetical protein
MNKFIEASIFWKRHFWICPASLPRKDPGKLLCIHLHDFRWIIMKARLAAFPSPICNEWFHWPPSNLVASDGIMRGVYRQYLNGVGGEMRYRRWIGMLLPRPCQGVRRLGGHWPNIYLIWRTIYSRWTWLYINLKKSGSEALALRGKQPGFLHGMTLYRHEPKSKNGPAPAPYKEGWWVVWIYKFPNVWKHCNRTDGA